MVTLETDMTIKFSMKEKSEIEYAHELLVCDGDNIIDAENDFIEQCICISNKLNRAEIINLGLKKE